MLRRLVLAPIFFCFFSSLVFAASVYDGWWFNPAESGSGLSIGIQGDTMFVALYTYDEAGMSLWMTSGAKYDPGNNSYSGRLVYWSLGDESQLTDEDSWWYTWLPLRPPVPHDKGILSITFTSEDTGVLRYGPESHPIEVPIERFMPQISPGNPDNRVLGWWYDPEYDGTGVFLEARGGVLFGAWYFYWGNEEESILVPAWLTFSGSFSPSARSFSAGTVEWLEGSPLGVPPYKAPKAYENTLQMRMRLNLDGSIDMSFTQTEYNWTHERHMVPFRF